MLLSQGLAIIIINEEGSVNGPAGQGFEELDQLHGLGGGRWGGAGGAGAPPERNLFPPAVDSPVSKIR